MAAATLASFRAAYPSFTATDDADVVRYLEAAAVLYVGPHWGDNEARGGHLYAAHRATLATEAAAGDTGQVIKSIGSGSHKIEFQNTAPDDGTGWDATDYGEMFAVLLARYSRWTVRAI